MLLSKTNKPNDNQQHDSNDIGQREVMTPKGLIPSD